MPQESTLIKNATQLKERQRKERDGYNSTINLRVHRAISWLTRAEECDDLDGRFLFLWISFNCAYANDRSSSILGETKTFTDFIKKLVRLDVEKKIYNTIWQKYSGAFRLILDNKYVFQPFWNHHNGHKSAANWEEQFTASQHAAHTALANKDTATVLSVVFNRLYTLRNQMVHGGATHNSSTNRDQLRDGVNILGDLVPLIIEIMMNNHKSYWGKAGYPVVE